MRANMMTNFRENANMVEVCLMKRAVEADINLLFLHSIDNDMIWKH